jgi:hypothetical protein
MAIASPSRASRGSNRMLRARNTIVAPPTPTSATLPKARNLLFVTLTLLVIPALARQRPDNIALIALPITHEVL